LSPKTLISNQGSNIKSLDKEMQLSTNNPSLNTEKSINELPALKENSVIKSLMSKINQSAIDSTLDFSNPF
jgi:hypothetical protein